MSLRLLIDADFNGRVIRGLLRREPSIDLLRVQNVGMRTAPDWEILDWAAVNDRIVLSHDRETMTAYAKDTARAHK
jgi:predicted nuclease of predicted toxin-antitoxin system